MSFATFITRQRNQYAFDLLNSKKYWSLSAIALSYFRVMSNITKDYVKGKTLDAGAGGLNGRLLLIEYCSDYLSLDIKSRNGDVDIIADIQNIDNIDCNTFDTVYSSQVIEHIQKPWKAISEIYRVLKPGGYAILSVPHLSGLHEEPFDFYRYTPYGIKFLMEEAGFIVEAEHRAGGLISFLSHPFSLIGVSLFWPVFGFRWLVWWFNKIFIVHPAIWLDQVLKLDRKFPANLVIVGRKA